MIVTVKKEYLHAGIGLVSAVLVGAVIAYFRSRTKIDLCRFDSPDIPGSGKCMDKEFLKMLIQVKKESGLPIFDWVISGARSEYWNRKVGGVRSSAHKIPKCRAADIKVPNIATRDRLVAAAKKVGFRRIGIGTTSVHLDNDLSKSHPVAWGYPVGSPPPYNPFG